LFFHGCILIFENWVRL